ncbi:redoxin domain-containing protein [Spongiivirga sp. MCCC 1A20706]|uniref:redoxin domain-containing protein n=1 Tax=Spongiivirga sp. MCCC 1A20706 TaxID=3160963 RepID=UPI003977B289
MKKIVWVFAAALVIIGCSETKKDGYFVNVSLAGMADGKKVFLKKFDKNSRFVNVDTSAIEFESVFFEGISATPELHYIVVDGVKGNIPVVLEEGSITVEAYKDSIALSKVSGSISNDELTDYTTNTRKLYKELQDLQNAFAAASQRKDMDAVNSIRQQFKEVQDRGKNADLNFVEQNPNSYVALLILERILDTKAQPTARLKELYERVPDRLKASQNGKSLSDKFAALGATDVGMIAPNFTGKTPDGKDIALNDVIGDKVTVVDFWASWCKPCRVENPSIVKMYNEYHEQGLNILGVSLDNNQEKWTKAIEEDQLTWSHISNLQSWKDPIAKKYNVSAIPQTFILDENGAIVAKDLRGEALQRKVKELLGVTE